MICNMHLMRSLFTGFDGHLTAIVTFSPARQIGRVDCTVWVNQVHWYGLIVLSRTRCRMWHDRTPTHSALPRHRRKVMCSCEWSWTPSIHVLQLATTTSVDWAACCLHSRKTQWSSSGTRKVMWRCLCYLCSCMDARVTQMTNKRNGWIRRYKNRHAKTLAHKKIIWDKISFLFSNLV